MRFICLNTAATDIFIKLIFKQSNIFRKLVNNSRNLTVEASQNCTHFEIEGGIVKRQQLSAKSISSILELIDNNGNQTTINEDKFSVILHLECCDPENKLPFTFHGISFNSKQKRKSPDENRMMNQLVILSDDDSDRDSGEFSNSSSDKENSKYRHGKV